MAEGFDKCEGNCKHWAYCDWCDSCGVCNTCPAYGIVCDGKEPCYMRMKEKER